jgi:hypothetical protein
LDKDIQMFNDALSSLCVPLRIRMIEADPIWDKVRKNMLKGNNKFFVESATDSQPLKFFETLGAAKKAVFSKMIEANQCAAQDFADKHGIDVVCVFSAK